MREVGLESNEHVLEFAAKLLAGNYDLILFMTGVGVRAMLEIVQTRYDRDEFLAALRKVKIAARGAKPSSVLRDLKIAVDVTSEEPSTLHSFQKKISENSETPSAASSTVPASTTSTWPSRRTSASQKRDPSSSASNPSTPSTTVSSTAPPQSMDKSKTHKTSAKSSAPQPLVSSSLPLSSRFKVSARRKLFYGRARKCSSVDYCLSTTYSTGMRRIKLTGAVKSILERRLKETAS
nr:uroporphyrinogen-III synthase [Edaphobacter lichenicola]